MKRLICFFCLVVGLGGAGLSDTAHAVKYMSIGKAVKTFIPEGAKIIKVTKGITSDQRKRIKEDYGWDAKERKYVFYVGKEGEERVAYVFIVREIFSTCFHKYAVGMKGDGEIIETVIVELSCPRSFPINRKGFLAQFRGKEHHDGLSVNVDIDGITGATLSSEATAIASRKAVSLHNIFFGGNEQVKVAANVKAGRAAAAGQIQLAIETGETLKKEGKSGAAQLPPGE